MTVGFFAVDRVGRMALTGIARNMADARRAVDIGCDPTHAPYRVERFPINACRVSIEMWEANITTDKAVDLRTNQGWEDLA